MIFSQQSETKTDASETEPEEGSEKKKKKKKKKKTKSPTDVEKAQNESIIIQEPPRIEVPRRDLCCCFFKLHKCIRRPGVHTALYKFKFKSCLQRMLV